MFTNQNSDEETIQVQSSVWQNMTQQLQQLKQQNERLKKMVTKLGQSGPQYIEQQNDEHYEKSDNNKQKNTRQNHQQSWKISSTMLGTMKHNQQKQCQMCGSKLQQYKQFESINYQNMQRMKEEWQLWSKKLQNSILSKRKVAEYNEKLETEGNINHNLAQSQIERHHRYSIHNILFDEKQNQIQYCPKPTKCELVEQVCLFGPQEEQIIQMSKKSQRKSKTKHQMYYPISNMKYEVYGNYIYPEQAIIRNIKQRNCTMQTNRMIFKKNSKKQQCSMFIFQSQQNHPIHNENNPYIEKLNPSKWLHALSIEFDDYIVLQRQGIQQNLQEADLSTQQPHNFGNLKRSNSNNLPNEALNSNNISLTENQSPRKSSLQSNVFKSQYCLCILSYFPFVGFLSQLLIRIMDQIKIRRMNLYNNDNYQQVDIKYFIQQLGNITKKILNEIRQIPINNHFTATLTVSESNQVSIQVKQDSNVQLVGLMCDQWAYRMLKLFDKDTFYQVYCYVMLQASIFFVCSNKYFLTFMLMLFVSILARPFGYPHPCVSIVFDDQLLQTPFTAILGINKGSEWLDNHVDFLLSNKQNVVIINLNEDTLKIKMKKKIKSVKSEKLKKIINCFYKRMENMHGNSIFKKNNMNDILYKEITKEENQATTILMIQLQKYYDDEILCYLPNEAIIGHIKAETIKSVDNQSQVNYQLLKYIDKYLQQSRKNKQKDQFIEFFLQRQILSVYLARRYDLS